jgi:hypothetical protein
MLGSARISIQVDIGFGDVDFDGSTLAEAIARTFERRTTTLPAEVPQGLSTEFKRDAVKTNQRRAIVRKGTLVHDRLALPDVCDFIGELWLAPGPWK